MKEEEKVEIPDFMKAYYKGSDYEGQAILDIAARNYQKEWQHYQTTTHAQQQAIHNSLFGSRSKKIDPAIGFAPIKELHQKQAYALAIKHGYTGPEFPEQAAKAKAQGDGSQQDDMISERQEVINSLKEIRSRQTASKQPKEQEQGATDNAGQKASTEMEQFLQNLKSIRERNVQQLRPRR